MKLHMHHMLVIAFVLGGSLGCQKAQDAIINTALEKATGAKIDHEKGEVTIQTDQGEVRAKAANATAGLSLPPEFPSDIYLPKPHKVLSTIVVGDGLSISASSPAEVDVIFNELEQNMQSQGWKREMALRGDHGSTIAFSKGEQRQVQFTLGHEEEGGSFLGIFISLPDKN